MKIILRKSILGSVSYCLVILRTPPYWLVRVALCNLNLAPGIHFSADHAQQATCKLSSTSQKISARKNLARVAADEQNGPRLREFIGKSGSDSTKIAYFGLSYISIQIANTRYNCKWHLKLKASLIGQLRVTNLFSQYFD